MPDSVAIPLVALAIAGCNRHTGTNPSAAGNTSSPGTPAANAQIDPATAGSVSGTIRFNGKAPARIVIDMAQDPACSQGSTTLNMTEQYVVHDGRLANVFVYVKDGLGNRIYMPTKTPIVLDQKGCRYIPHVIGAMVGQPVEFRNSDHTMHNIHIVPPGSDDSSGFDISQAPMAGTEQHMFRNAGLMIPVRCNNHPWMEAFLNVVKNPFFRGFKRGRKLSDSRPAAWNLHACRRPREAGNSIATDHNPKPSSVDSKFCL